MEKTDQLSWIYKLYRMGQSEKLRESPAEVQQQILEHIVAGFDADGGSLALCRGGDCHELSIVATVGLPAGIIGNLIPKDEGVLGWVAEHGEHLLLNGDISGDIRFRNSQQRTKAARPDYAMCWPLQLERGVLGALSISRKGKAYAESDLEHGATLVNLITIVIENAQLHSEQQQRIKLLAELNERNQEFNNRIKISHEELHEAYCKLQETQNQLLQAEKMASIGQLAAGVAHEINNPIGYVYSNLGSLQKYLEDIFSILDAYSTVEPLIAQHAEAMNIICAAKQKADLEFLREDVAALMSESREGVTRVRKIVQDLRDFSHVGSEDEWQMADLRQGIDSTLNIVNSELKYKAEVRKEYADVSDIECLPSQLNQVFLNLLVNAAHAIEGRGTITIRISQQSDVLSVEIADTGIGIAPEHLSRIFDPFFTTKPVGTGTGLGLSVSYSIIQKHHGRIEVESKVGRGTTFRIMLPVTQPEVR